MTAPRQVFAGDYYLVTRRCTQRQFLLRPCEYVDQVYLYCLGEAALRFNVSLCAWLAMSNHHHVVVRDNDGRLPEFLAHLHKMIAKVLNEHWDRSENFWSNEQASAVRLARPADVLSKIIYTLANPVADHLVARAEEWPGASSLRLNLHGGAITVERPAFFRADGPMPAKVSLHVERPVGFEDLTHEGWAKLLTDELRASEAAARETRKQEKVLILGAKAVLATRHTDSAKTRETVRAHNPVLACQDAELRVHLLAAILTFRFAHREARRAWRAGDHTARFPPGTYSMRALGARCERSPKAAAPPDGAVRARLRGPSGPAKTKPKPARITAARGTRRASAT